MLLNFKYLELKIYIKINPYKIKLENMNLTLLDTKLNVTVIQEKIDIFINFW